MTKIQIAKPVELLQLNLQVIGSPGKMRTFTEIWFNPQQTRHLIFKMCSVVHFVLFRPGLCWIHLHSSQNVRHKWRSDENAKVKFTKKTYLNRLMRFYFFKCRWFQIFLFFFYWKLNIPNFLYVVHMTFCHQAGEPSLSTSMIKPPSNKLVPYHDCHLFTSCQVLLDTCVSRTWTCLTLKFTECNKREHNRFVLRRSARDFLKILSRSRFVWITAWSTAITVSKHGNGLWLLSCHFFNWVTQQLDRLEPARWQLLVSPW